MGNAVEDLIVNLEEQISNLEAFEGLLSEQQQLILKNDVGPFQESLAEQNRLIFAAKEIEHKRQVIVDSYQKEQGDTNPQATLDDICRQVESGYAEQLRDIKKTLTDSMRKVERLKEKNEILINKSLEIISDTMKIYYQGDDRGKQSYSAKGSSLKNTGSSRVVLNEVI